MISKDRYEDFSEYEKWPEQYKKDPNPKKKVMKVGKKITDVAAHMLGSVKAEDPEHWGLKYILDDEMVEVCLKMKKRKHYTFPELCKLMKVKEGEEEKLQNTLDRLSYCGMIEYDYGYHYDHNGRTAPQSERRYILPMFVPGSAELFNIHEMPEDMRNQRIIDHPELASFFERMTYIPLKGITQAVPPGGAGIGMHVIPVEKAIEMENTSIDIEHLSYWLKKYEGHIGVARCSCRASRKVMGDGCPDDDLGWCIGVGDFADYCRETHKGHDITYDEAMAILRRAEENGFVHQITNIDGENKIFGICNCNVEICNALRTSQLFNTPNMSRSAYVAHVDKSKCVACGRCVEYCPAGATRLGQKLCDKSGKELEYPRQELPDNKWWNESKYDFNYRDNNRINTHKTGTAPCKAACPAHVAVQGYLKLAAKGDYQGALELIKKQNPFPAICGRVCNKRCEDACTRGRIDKAVAIDAVKKFIAEQDLNAETRFIPKKVVPASIHMDHFDEKIAIIGAGPAGLSAAFYLASIGYFPTVFEKNAAPGGMLRYGIPSYKLEKDIIDAEIEVMKEMGVEIRCNVEVGKDITIADLREQGYKAFYIAIGCQGGRKPGIPGENSEGTMTALDYLAAANCGNPEEIELRLGHVVRDIIDYAKNSVTYKGNVVVVGGGNVAIDAARVSVRNGAKAVSMVCLEQVSEMPASKDEQMEAKEDGVAIVNGWGPKEVIEKDGKVSAIVFKKCTRVYDETGKFSPLYDENDTMTIECDRVIFAIGQKTEWGELLKGEAVKFNGARIEADSFTYQTDVPDIFVGGDVFTGPKFAIDAIQAGHVAADSLHRYVHDAHMVIGRNRWQFNMLDKDNITVEGYDTAGRQEAGMDENIPALSFKDAHLTLTEEQVKIETSRCLGCGSTIVDPNKCIGCGVCTTKCMFDAITLHRDNPDCSNMVIAEDKFKAMLPYQFKRWGRMITKK